MSVWILRPDLGRKVGPGRMPVEILQMTPEGDEVELESFTLETENASEATGQEGLLRRLLYGEFAKGRRRLVLDLGTLDKPVSSTIGEIFAAFHHIKNAGGELVLANLTIKTQDVIEICQLHHLIPIFKSVRDAVDYLEGRSQAPVDQLE